MVVQSTQAVMLQYLFRTASYTITKHHVTFLKFNKEIINHYL